MKPTVNLIMLGRLSYTKALNIQQVLFDKLKTSVTTNSIKNSQSLEGVLNHTPSDDCQVNLVESIRPNDINKNSFSETKKSATRGRNFLLLVEHEPVYTWGIRSKNYGSDYVSKLRQKLKDSNLKAEMVGTNRGGLITFHGPGQLVAYPIIYLGDFMGTIENKSIKSYVNLLETTIIDTLACVGLRDGHVIREYPGVWLEGGEKKVAFIGIACKRFVTMHGVSINCDCDLSWFDHIVSCGIEGKLITSIRQELIGRRLNPIMGETFSGHRLSDNASDHDHSELISREDKLKRNYERITDSKCNVERVSEAFCDSFRRHFDCNLVRTSLEDILN